MCETVLAGDELEPSTSTFRELRPAPQRSPIEWDGPEEPTGNWSGTSDSNRDSLGPRPSGLIRFPSPRNTKQQSVGRNRTSGLRFGTLRTPSAPYGVTGGNRTLVDRSTVCRLSHSATATLGARSTSRTCLSGFSDRRLDRNGLPGKFGGRGGNRTLICWLQASGPPVERLPQESGCGLAS